MTTEWVCLIGETPDSRKCPVRLEVADHPLKPMTVTMLESRGTRKFGSNSSSIGSSTLSLDPLSGCLEGVDPLSQFSRESDPLSQMAAEYESSNNQKLVETPLGDSVEQPWSARRSAVLNKFITSEKLTIVTSFLTGGEMIKTQTTVSEKVKHRLEQLDDFDEGSFRQMMNLTQQEYVIKIEQLNQELIQAWHSDQRVKSLKIAIQCSKFLADTSVMQFYPSKFVLVTDILDIFGKLVFERLKTKADHLEIGKQQGVVLPDNFTPEMVSESTKETCLNWFYKVASIRELLPRLYVEMAILKCYSFLTSSEFNNALLRLTKMIRGIGDPLIAMYARCYLCRIGMTVTSDREYIKENLNDFLETYQTMFSAGVKTEMFRQRMDISSYLSIYSPGLDWIMEGIAARAPDSLLNEILSKCQAKQNNGLLLTSIISTFNPQFIATHANEFVSIISASATEGITKSQLFRSLGSSLSILPPPQAERLNILNKVWSTVRTFTHPSEYIVCVENWAEYTTKHVEINDLNSFLGEIVTHMTPKRAFENHYGELQSIVEKVVANTSDLEALLILDNFLPLLDLFQKESVRLDVCKYILTIYKNNCSEGCLIRDPIVTNALMFICKNLNDAVNALTVEDERRQICYLISHFIKQVDFGRDFEQQLTFYIDARAAFPNLDLTYATLVQCVVKLAMDTRKIVKGQHSRKTGAFVKACAAYCFITIPSIVSVMTRLDLYLLAGQIALVNLCLGQADSCFEAAINLIPELPKYMEIDGKQKNTENYLISYICNFLSTLIIVPDSPDQGVLYLIRLLIDSIKQYPFDTHGNGISTIYLHILDMLSVSSQEIYPYHIPNVVSNDELYGSDPKFLAEINSICSEIVDQILINLKFLGDANQLRIQSTLSLELFQRIVGQSDVRNDKMFGLAVNLWNLAVKNRNSLEPKLLQKSLQIVGYYSKRSPSLVHSKKLDELLQKIKTKL